ncbi:MAG: LysE family translocator [Ktedonobacterales bacterium]
MYLMDARFAAFVAVTTLLIVTPGPDTALVTRNALISGRRAASFTTLGIGVGSAVWGLASVLGIAILIERSMIAFTVFKLVGAAYLGALGLRSLVASFRTHQPAAATAPRPRPAPLAGRAALKQGLLGNLLNPKAGAIFISVLPQFIRPGDAPIRLVVMMLAYEVILMSWLHVVGYLMSRARQSGLGSRIHTGLQRVTGVVLIGLGVRLALDRQ